MWIHFLELDKFNTLNRPMVDIILKPVDMASEMLFYSNASAKFDLGFSAILGQKWLKGVWEPGFIENNEPSIEYLELYTLCAGILTWKKHLTNIHMLVHCDNQAVVAMINGLASKCGNCMTLLQILILDGLIHNRKISTVYITSRDNFLSDALSRGQMNHFKWLGPHMNLEQDQISSKIWPMSKIWRD